MRSLLDEEQAFVCCRFWSCRSACRRSMWFWVMVWGILEWDWSEVGDGDVGFLLVGMGFWGIGGDRRGFFGWCVG